LASLRAAEELRNDRGTEPNVAAKAQNARYPIGVGVHPAGGNLQERGDLVSIEKSVEATKPLFNWLAMKPVIHTEAFESRNLTGVRTNPLYGHDEDVGDFLVRQK
jgi:hypothetical protein